ncbi:hypothetical protein QBC40DRAFT_194556 [Triangularia verruculosa]|uniref:EamA domain-containing protein n=1 Tax=Triangularia verruculosa TaxID=2587418 RepID=A0AAN6XMX1_9PEZI|nr:hypothetical protein QBC40DRAFT_194556 [Triangularia verruculosa]
MAPEPLMPAALAPDHHSHPHHHRPSADFRRYEHHDSTDDDDDDSSVHSQLSNCSSSDRRRSQHYGARVMLGGMSVDHHSPSSAGRSSHTTTEPQTKLGFGGVARKTLGICLLLVVVFFWTVSNFLASYIFSDGTYNKPFFLVYVNTSMFAISLVPITGRYIVKNGWNSTLNQAKGLWRGGGGAERLLKNDEEDGERLLEVEDEGSLEANDFLPKEEKLSLKETAWLSLEFCMLWFFANYFASACLEYTSVGSVTILTSTSSIWTLVFGALKGVEGFSVRKLVGVLASLVGVVLISSVDLSGLNDGSRGSFPHKSTWEIAVGDGMALFSAVVYGIYVTVMKLRVGNEERVDMGLFFGLVGLINVVLLWPGFFVLHFTGLEPFEWPPTGTVWAIIMLNSVASFFSDIIWAYAMLLTTPLIVTVGLSLNIPVSLVGEMIQYSQYSSWLYWVGAGIVVLSFVFVTHESQEGEGET